jgi:hypothetical protein
VGTALLGVSAIFTTLGPIIIGVGTVIGGLVAQIGFLYAVFGPLGGIAGIVISSLLAIGGIFTGFFLKYASKTLPIVDMLKGFVSVLERLGAVLQKSLGGISAAIILQDLDSAWRIFVLTGKISIAELGEYFKQIFLSGGKWAWDKIKAYMMYGLPGLSESIGQDLTNPERSAKIKETEARIAALKAEEQLIIAAQNRLELQRDQLLQEAENIENLLGGDAFDLRFEAEEINKRLASLAKQLAVVDKESAKYAERLERIRNGNLSLIEMYEELDKIVEDLNQRMEGRAEDATDMWGDIQSLLDRLGEELLNSTEGVDTGFEAASVGSAAAMFAGEAGSFAPQIDTLSKIEATGRDQLDVSRDIYKENKETNRRLKSLEQSEATFK